jgi:dolichyl-phosphate beta-glucosyltransferase
MECHAPIGRVQAVCRAIMAECIVVIPCFNEAHRLDLRAFVEHAAAGEASLLFVNDGSTDGTADVLDDLCAVSPAQFAVLHLDRNGGKAEAVRRGVLQAFERRPAAIGYWDADLATPLAAIAGFRDYLGANPRVELLLGARVRLLGRAIERRISRHCAGRVFATAASWVLKLPVYDTQCGAKLFRATGRMRSVFAHPFRSRWIFDVELLARFVQAASLAGQSPEELIHELPLQAWRDVAGSKVRASDFLRAAVQLADIACRYRLPRQAGGAAIADRSSMPTASNCPRAASHPSSELEPVS